MGVVEETERRQNRRDEAYFENHLIQSIAEADGRRSRQWSGGCLVVVSEISNADEAVRQSLQVSSPSKEGKDAIRSMRGI